MRVAVMQPYLFPYWPYLQLMASVDVFVILSTVQFNSRGWARRNSILLNGAPHLFSIPIQHHSRSTCYGDIYLSKNISQWSERFDRTLVHAYKGALSDNIIRDIVHKTLDVPKDKVRSFCETFGIMYHALKNIIPIKSKILDARDLTPRGEKTAQEYIISMVKEIGATSYVNAIGGRQLYCAKTFEAQGLKLQFINGTQEPYNQNTSQFISNLSCLDLIARLSTDELTHRLANYTIED